MVYTQKCDTSLAAMYHAYIFEMQEDSSFINYMLFYFWFGHPFLRIQLWPGCIAANIFTKCAQVTLQIMIQWWYCSQLAGHGQLWTAQLPVEQGTTGLWANVACAAVNP